MISDIICDWMTLRHDYPVERPANELDSGRILKISADGEIEYEARQWEMIRCSSSDTSLRIKCDGLHLWCMGNIGRFQEMDNINGLTVMQCLDKWSDVLRKLGISLDGFGTRWRQGHAAEYGTHFTRIDLAGNFEVSDYAALCQSALNRRIGQRLPIPGKYGPTWGYDTKRSNWMKAKLYDKTAEIEGRRITAAKETLARFEVQLGSEWLKRYGYDVPLIWKGDDMEKVIYGRFAEQIFKDSHSVEDWADIPPRLRIHAILWRDGVDIRSQVSQATFYRVRKQLLDGYGIDIGTPCNVIGLSQKVRICEVRPVSALRRAA